MAIVDRATFARIAENTKLFLRDRSTAYKLFIRQPAGQLIMSDLLKFSHWAEGMPLKAQTEFDRGRIIGRQDIIRRIEQHVHLSSDQLFALYNGQQIPQLIAQQEDDDD